MNRRRCSLWVGLAMALAAGLAPAGAGPLQAADNRAAAAPAPATQPNKSKGLSAEDIKDAMEVLRDTQPELASQINDVTPERAREMVAKVWPKIRPWVDGKRHDPEMYALNIADFKLTHRCDDLVKRIKTKVDSGSEDALLAELRDVLRERFEVSLKMREIDVRRREEQVRQMQEQVHKMQELVRKTEEQVGKMREELAQKTKDEAKAVETQFQHLTGIRPAPAPK